MSSHKLTIDNGSEKRTVKTGSLVSMIDAALEKIDAELGKTHTWERDHARTNLLTKYSAEVNGYKIAVEPDEE